MPFPGGLIDLGVGEPQEETPAFERAVIFQPPLQPGFEPDRARVGTAEKIARGQNIPDHALPDARGTGGVAADKRRP